MWQIHIVIIMNFQRRVSLTIYPIRVEINFLEYMKLIHNMKVISVRLFVHVFIFEITNEFSWNSTSMLEAYTKYSVGEINIAFVSPRYRPKPCATWGHVELSSSYQKWLLVLIQFGILWNVLVHFVNICSFMRYVFIYGEYLTK
jgi:hypothetical protein